MACLGEGEFISVLLAVEAEPAAPGWPALRFYEARDLRRLTSPEILPKLGFDGIRRGFVLRIVRSACDGRRLRESAARDAGEPSSCAAGGLGVELDGVDCAKPAALARRNQRRLRALLGSRQRWNRSRLRRRHRR